ncbi:recombinase family protein [Aquihabitans sp. G128]|uniref:recombinase family protein n=1 Tax=Aquihabitans sp. G128 TaxID=2849779 RepID=UPI00352F942B
MGLGAAIERQTQECEALVERNGWQITQRYPDNAISAPGRKRKPDYEALCAAIASGSVTALVAWDPDGLHRKPSESSVRPRSLQGPTYAHLWPTDHRRNLHDLDDRRRRQGVCSA